MVLAGGVLFFGVGYCCSVQGSLDFAVARVQRSAVTSWGERPYNIVCGTLNFSLNSISVSN